MAVDPGSVPKDLRPLTLNRTSHPLMPETLSPSLAPPPWAPFPCGGGELTEKVKLLCSFGGRILPRPKDGALRYVCGHTRLVSVPRDISFAGLMKKMADVVNGDAVVFKYQLPGEDLDALVSVSCPEDFDNMMEEYDKLAAASPGGSAKLRVFLFTQSDLADQSLDLGAEDAGQRYIEAVNGVEGDGIGGIIRRKESVESVASSTQNSESTVGGEAVDCINEGMSPQIISSDAGYMGVCYPVGGNFSELGLNYGLQNPNLVRPEQTPVVPCMPQAYIDPYRVQYINSPQMGLAGGNQFVNVVPLSVNSYVPGVPILTTAAMPASQVSLHMDPNLDKAYFGRPSQLPGDQNQKVLQPLSQLPHLGPSNIQEQNGERYGMGSMLPPPANAPGFRYDDCIMCQKALPHVHSDTLMPGNANASPGNSVVPVFCSQHSECLIEQPSPTSHSRALGDSVAEEKVESPITTAQSGGYGLSHIPEARQASRRQVTIDPPRVLLHKDVMGLSGDAPLSNGVVLGNLPGPHVEDPFQQQQQQGWQNLQPSQYPVKQVVVCKTIGIDASPVKNFNSQTVDPIQDYVSGFTHDYARAVDARMQALHVHPSGNPELNGKQKPIGSHIGAVSQVNVDSPSLLVQSGHKVLPQVGGHLHGNTVASSVFIPEENRAKPIEQVPSACPSVAVVHKDHPDRTQEAITIRNHNPFPHSFDFEYESSDLNESFPARPVYSGGAIPVYSGGSTAPNVGKKDEASQLRPGEMLDNLCAPPSANAQFLLTTITGPTQPIENFQEPVSSDSLFSNHDPWKVLENKHLLPATPGRLVNKESAVTVDSIIDHSGATNRSTIVALLEEGNLPCMPDFPSKETISDPVQVAEGEDSVKLQAVAEGVAASVLQPSVSPDSSFFSHEASQDNSPFDKEAGLLEDNVSSRMAFVDPKVEDIKSNPSDKTGLGIQMVDDIGHLQIIKNSDLEELRELGSGTFGTVYHGKWRGSEVAIKRINDRCFAGKPSEQERMRTDFWNEACKLAVLHHPNVVAFYGVVLDGPGGSVATVTEYMVNGSLRQALQRNDKVLDCRKQLIIAMDVAFGMEYLHGKNIVHFDLKSDNLLVNLRDPQRPICKVGDLGLSKVKCQTLISGGVRGTLPWMAPELLNGSSSLVSEKVDVFSFGIVMWELLTREEPYADLHYGAIIGGIVSNTLRPPVPESCDPEWRSLMEHCWSSEPSERPSFTEIANRLRSMAASVSQKVQTQSQK
ncbi:uncharacterized protein [Typha angustifolia]|uniref:uncharacterized protein isoform X2 n=1 Tax=Typha angustifolia TaxID=59011 RepID=UPI003C2AF4CB